MFRIICVLAIIGLLLFGFLPRPLFSPDWKTPLEKAVAANDCKAAERITDILGYTGHTGDYYSTVLRLGKSGHCRFAKIPERALAGAKTLGEDYSRSTSPYDIIARSPFGSQILRYFGGRPYSRNSAFHSAQDLYQSARGRCRDKFDPVAGGAPNINLLAYAVAHPEVSGDDIRKIAFESSALCVHEFVQIAKLMEASARNRDEFELATDVLGLTQLHLGFAPTQNRIFSIVRESLLARGVEGRFLAEEENAECIGHGLAAADLWSSGICAENMASGSMEQAVSAVYFARRAKRLGWRDVETAEAIAVEKLPAECVAAMTDLEAKEAGDKIDPRDFERRDWPVGPGAACGAASN